MPLIKFIGYTGVLLLLESIVLALLGALLVIPVAITAAAAVKAGLGENLTGKILDWLVFGIKIITAWLVANLLVLGAKHYAVGNTMYFWAFVIIGGLLSMFFKIDSIRTHEKSAYDAAMRRWNNADLAMAEIRISSLPKLWQCESIFYNLAFAYVLIVALFNSLAEFEWLKTTLNGILWIFTIQSVLSVILYLAGWFFVCRYLFAICISLLALPGTISRKSNKNDLGK
jgi:hypothetical protein